MPPPEPGPLLAFLPLVRKGLLQAFCLLISALCVALAFPLAFPPFLGEGDVFLLAGQRVEAPSRGSSNNGEETSLSPPSIIEASCESWMGMFLSQRQPTMIGDEGDKCRGGRPN